MGSCEISPDSPLGPGGNPEQTKPGHAAFVLHQSPRLSCAHRHGKLSLCTRHAVGSAHLETGAHLNYIIPIQGSRYTEASHRPFLYCPVPVPQIHLNTPNHYPKPAVNLGSGNRTDSLAGQTTPTPKAGQSSKTARGGLHLEGFIA